MTMLSADMSDLHPASSFAPGRVQWIRGLEGLGAAGCKQQPLGPHSSLLNRQQ